MRMKTATLSALMIAAATLIVGCAGGALSASGRDAVPAIAQPLAEWEELPNATRTGSTTFGGQPSVAVLERFAAEGGTLVVDNRTHEGADIADFDEAAEVERLGMTYLHIPMTGESLTRADVDRFAEAIEEADGPTLLHCRSGNRSGGLWAAYLALHKGVETEAAIEAGKAAGMRSPPVEASARRVVGD